MIDRSFLRLAGSAREHNYDNVQYYDAKRGNLVVLDATSTNFASEELVKLLGDWETEVNVGYVSRALRNEDTKETEFLDVTLCEPWAMDSSGKPVLPVWAAVQVQEIMEDEELPLDFKLDGVPDFVELSGTTWEEVKELPWLPIHAVPMKTWDAFYGVHLRKPLQAKDQTSAFMGIPGLGAVTNMGLLRRGHKTIGMRFDFNHLLFTLQVEPGEREKGARIDADALKRMTLLGKINNLRESLKIDSEDPEISKLNKLSRQVEKELAALRKGKRAAARTALDDNDN